MTTDPSVAPESPPPDRPIAPDLTPVSPPSGRVYRRRRLGVLSAAALLVVGALAALGPVSADADISVASGSDAPVQVQSASGPVTLSAVIAETTSTLLAATTTTSPTTTTGAAETTTTAPPTTAPPTTSPPTTAAPTTAAPTTAPPTTARVTSAPTPPPTTTAPNTVPEGDYEYDDPRGLQVWLDLADCESHGNWSADYGNGYYGGLQFSLGTWESVGGDGYPHEHPRDTQIEMGRRLQARSGWDQWPHCASELGLT